MQIPLLDLKRQYNSIEAELKPRLEALYASQQFILGAPVTNIEAEIAKYCQCAYACGVTSGSDALQVSLMAAGIGAGDEVITSAYTFFATAGAICRVGAKPVFVDITPDTYNIDVTKIEERITSRTKAIIPVHLYGQVADMGAVMEIAKKHNLVVIEDACQAIGSEYKGRRAGSIGDFGCLSFFPSKNLGCFGDGGMVTTNDAKFSEKLAILRNHGMAPQYHHHLVGSNFRLDAIQAEVLLVKLPYLDGWCAARQKNAADYNRMLAGCEGVVTPVTADYCTQHVCNQYVVRIKNGRRDQVWDDMKAAGIGCAVYYPIPLHLQECFKDLNYKKGDFPNSEAAANETLALPIFPELTMEEKEAVAETLIRLVTK